MNDTIFVVLICILSVMHYVILNLKRIFNPRHKTLIYKESLKDTWHVPFPRQCWDVIAKLRG